MRVAQLSTLAAILASFSATPSQSLYKVARRDEVSALPNSEDNFYRDVVVLEEFGGIFNISDPRLADTFDRFERARRCRIECTKAYSYGNGFCAAVAGFGAPIVCFLSGYTDPMTCALAQGITWAFGGFCTSGASQRVCEICEKEMDVVDLSEIQILNNIRLKALREQARRIRSHQVEMRSWMTSWKEEVSTLEWELRMAGHFEDVEHVLMMMNRVTFTAEGVPKRNRELDDFLAASLSSSRHGLVSLLHNLHRVVAGGAHCENCFGGKKSVFEMNPDLYCSEEFIRSMESAILASYHALNFALSYRQASIPHLHSYEMCFLY